jgi:alginate O-acetyltransferase complex protein AlgJ
MQTTATTPSIISSTWLRYLPAGFMLLFLVSGLVMAFLSPSIFKLPEGKTFLNGQWAASYEAEFNKSLAIKQPSIDTWGILEYSLYKNGRDGVLVGKDGWLFTSEEFKFYPDGDKGIQEKLDLALKAQAQLAEQGINLVVVVVPSKARVYDEQLGRYNFPPYNQDVYQNFIETLESKGISTVKVLDALRAAKTQQAVFLKTDTHWTPAGAEIVAKEIAKVVGKKGLLPSLGSSSYQTTLTETIQHQGDLLNYVPLGSLQESLGPAFDGLEQRVTEGSGDGGGLFGSSSIPVALVGTSYSANTLWNFDGALKEFLGTDVLNVANQGEGPVVPMKDYLVGNDLKDTPPELVIWEIPERFIQVIYQQGDTN